MAKRKTGLVAAVELTNHCNFRCTFCPHAVYLEPPTTGNVFNRPKSFMDEETWRICVEQMLKHARSLTIGFFGEQMLHPRFGEFVSMVPKPRPFRYIFNSNWSLITHENIRQLDHFDEVRISLDAPDAETFEAMRPGAPVLTLAGVRTNERYDAIEEKVRYWMSHPHPQTHLIYVRADRNKRAQREFVAKWRGWLKGRDKICTKAVITYGGVTDRDPEMQVNPCKVPREDRFIVAWDGRVSPCNLDVNMAMTVANVRDGDARELTRSKAWLDQLAAIRRKEGVCEHCFDANNHSQRAYVALAEGQG